MSPPTDQAPIEAELTSVCRTAIGDSVRSITYFTGDAVDQVYLRDDLDHDADVGAFAENERLGFVSQQTYDDTELGRYRFTIRVFEWGYLVRTIVDDHGVFVTTDPLPMAEFKEVESAVHSVLKGLSS